MEVLRIQRLHSFFHQFWPTLLLPMLQDLCFGGKFFIISRFKCLSSFIALLLSFLFGINFLLLPTLSLRFVQVLDYLVHQKYIFNLIVAIVRTFLWVLMEMFRLRLVLPRGAKDQMDI